ncbi:MAG: hypothetical protein QOE31_3609, partial [Solirubrobacteraceae bacterium]|nr:hypothetical protein [Solirubrobacteraceae bacterium]
MVSQLLATILALGATGAPATQRAAESLRAAAPPPPAPQASSPTLRQLVGQHMVFAYDGPAPPAISASNGRASTVRSVASGAP